MTEEATAREEGEGEGDAAVGAVVDVNRGCTFLLVLTVGNEGE